MIDSHTHLNDEALYDSREEVIKRAKEAGVHTMLCVGYDLESSRKAVEIANTHEGVFVAVGYQPENIEGVDLEILKEIEKLAASSPKVIAIGEIGLDYHWRKKEEAGDRQKAFLIAQIEMANRLNLPISIHCRDAIGDMYEVLSTHTVERRGVLHCYSGSPEMLERFAKLGFYFGFGGVTTFKNAKTTKECATICPIDRLLLETDAPYLAPVPFRGQTNEPAYVPYVLKTIAELRGMDEKELERQTDENFRRLFHVEP